MDSRLGSGYPWPILYDELKCSCCHLWFWATEGRDHFCPRSRRRSQCCRAFRLSIASWNTLHIAIFTARLFYFFTSYDKFAAGLSIVLIGFEVEDGSLTPRAHEISHSCFNITYVVIVISLTIIVKDIEPNILARLEDVVDDEALVKVRIEIILSRFSFPQNGEFVMAEISLEGNLNVRVWFAKDVQILEVSAAQE